jgi:hypothetical protein
VWTVFARFFSTQTIAQKYITGEKTPVSHDVIAWLVGCYIFALLTPVAIWLGKRFPFHKDNWLRRLRVELSSDPAIQDAAVPQMGLQPIVENAIRHGIGRNSTAGKIRISANRIHDSLEIKVQEDGPGLDPASLSEGRGIGLSNIVTRLTQLYGDSAKAGDRKRRVRPCRGDHDSPVPLDLRTGRTRSDGNSCRSQR